MNKTSVSSAARAVVVLFSILWCTSLLAADEPVYQIQRLYLKEMQIEQPNSPAIFLATAAPTITTAVDNGSTKINDETYEVWVSVSITAKVKDKIAYVVKGRQAGIFTIKNVPAHQLVPLLGIGSPNIVYPYLRGNLADAITRAGFPPVHLAEINWEVFYAQQKKPKTSTLKR